MVPFCLPLSPNHHYLTFFKLNPSVHSFYLVETWSLSFISCVMFSVILNLLTYCWVEHKYNCTCLALYSILSCLHTLYMSYCTCLALYSILSCLFFRSDMILTLLSSSGSTITPRCKKCNFSSWPHPLFMQFFKTKLCICTEKILSWSLWLYHHFFKFHLDSKPRPMIWLLCTVFERHVRKPLNKHKMNNKNKAILTWVLGT